MNGTGKKQSISAKSVPPRRRKDKPMTTNQMVALFRKVIEPQERSNELRR